MAALPGPLDDDSPSAEPVPPDLGQSECYSPSEAQFEHDGDVFEGVVSDPDFDIADENLLADSKCDSKQNLSEQERRGLDNLAFESAVKNISSSGIVMPWETPQMQLIFGAGFQGLPKFPTMDPLASDLHVGRLPFSGFDSHGSSLPGSHTRAMKFHFRSRDLSEDEQTRLLLEKWRLVVHHNLMASELGRMIVNLEHEQQLKLVGDYLGGKAPATLRKRMSQVSKFLQWANNLMPPRLVFPVLFGDMRDYVNFLREDGKTYSTLSGVIELMLFLKHVIGVEVEDTVLKSTWLKGVLRQARHQRPPRRQSRALTVAELIFLERFLEDNVNNLIDRYAVGCFLFCVYSRARVGDISKISSIHVDIHRDGGVVKGYIECHSMSHKMRSASNALGLNLALVAPVQGVSEVYWGQTFIEVSKLVGYPLTNRSKGLPLLPVPDSSDSFTDVAVSSAEVGRWLKQILAKHYDKSGDDPCVLGTFTAHGMKATTLSFLAKWGATPETREILGHHSLKNRSSLECYSRDIQAGPLRSLERCLRDIRCGAFRPDLSRSGYIGSSCGVEDEHAGFVGPLEKNMGPEQQVEMVSEGEKDLSADRVESSCDSSSSSSSSSMDEIDIVEKCSNTEVDASYSWKPDCSVFQHVNTKTLHLKAVGCETSFVCGRKLEKDHKPFNGKIVMDGWKCKQCERGKPLRTTEGVVAALDRAVKRVRRH